MALKPETATELRGIVRDLLREALAGRGAAKTGVEAVKISNDAELAAFVTRLIEPATLEAVRTGKLRFTLAGSTPVASAAAPASNILDGVITEHKLNRLAGAAAVVLAPGAILTPLARDRARQLGLKIERRR